MRILYVNHAISDFGGIERYISETARRMIALGHEVEFLAMRRDGGPDAPAHLVFGAGLPKPLAHLIFGVLNPGRIRRLRRTRRIDVVVSNNSASLSADVVVANSVHEVALRKLSAYSKEEEPYLKYLLVRLIRAIRPQNLVTVFLERRAYRSARKVIAVSQGIRHELEGTYGIPAGRIAVIPNGADIGRFARDEAARAATRREIRAGDGTTVLLFVAHEFRRKGLRFVIEAMGLLKQRDLRLVVIGRDDPAPFRALAERLGIRDRVAFLGVLKSGLERYYAAADLFVFPTAYEAFSLATLEAGAAGLPLLLTRINGTDELVREGENGRFVERDAHDIAEKIGAVLATPGELERMGSASRQIAEAYSWDALVLRTLSVLEEARP